MARTFQFTVHYPLTEGRLVLRTDADWGADVEPAAVAPDGTWAVFSVETDQPFLYFKPVIRIGQQVVWAVGSDYLTTGDRDIYPHFRGGDAGTVTAPLRLASDALGEVVAIRVYEPPGYAENTLKRYPVLYMHDGDNLFFPEDAFGGQPWDVDDTLDLLASMSLVDKVLVVAISVGDRVRDYTKPGYDAYCRFVADELRPEIDRHFRTLPGPGNTATMGSSLGGVAAFFLAWERPEVFGQVACLSSTFGYKDDLMARVADEPRRDLRVYLDSGWPRDNFEVTRAMRTRLLQSGYRWGEDLLYFTFPLAQHREAAWAARLHVPFQFFYGRLQLAGR